MAAQLRGAIYATHVKTAAGRLFFPWAHVKELVTAESVIGALREARVAEELLQDVLAVILTEAPLLFAILVYTSRIADVTTCLEADVRDGSLPICDITTAAAVPPELLTAQWEFCAPVFGRSRILKKLKDDAILPFLHDEKISRGGFGTVYKITIPSTHQNIIIPAEGETTVVLCRKSLELSDDQERVTKDFRDEDRVIKLLTSLRNPNILEHLASYYHRGVYNIICPLADMDLALLLATERSQTPFRADTVLLSAIRGIASALHAMHDFRNSEFDKVMIGCHHDIKPQNILVFGSRFILADFGLARLKHAEDGSKTIFKGMGDYAAPECRGLDLKSQLVGRMSDIWSFGALLTELCHYMAGGPTAVTRFRDARLTKTGTRIEWAFHDGTRLKAPVQRCLFDLMESTHVDKSVSDLTAESVKMLQAEAPRRPSAAKVTAALLALHARSLFKGSSESFARIVDATENSSLLIEQARFLALKETYTLEEVDTTGLAALERVSSDAGERRIQLLSQLHEELEIFRRETVGYEQGTDLEVGNRAEVTASTLNRINGELVNELSPAQQSRVNHLLFRRLTMQQDLQGVEYLERLASKRQNNPGLRALLELKCRSLRFDIMNIADKLTSYHERESVKLEEPFESHTLGTFTPPGAMEERVLVEWRAFERIEDDKRLQKLLLQMQLLADLPNTLDKPKDFRILECRGFFLKQARNALGMIYRLPSMPAGSDTSHNKPISLRTVISKSRDIVTERLALGTRFAVAVAVTSCVYYFHTVGWVHKNFHSGNIVFCDGEHTIGPSLTSEPYIVGFNYSRSLEATDLTEDPNADELVYQHPAYLTDKLRQPPGMPLFQKRHDYYSVGVVLLEIALWKKAASLERKHKVVNADHFRQLLLTEYVPGLAYSMGDVYRQAAKACLESECADEEEFKFRVVDKLRLCFA